jgi:gamma-glutamylcyclotransferase (GGCT)/AIG2-like uncharacterized protein YtfP
MNLFTYGTLISPDVFRRVTHRTAPSTDAYLKGYRVFRIAGSTYPTAQATGSKQVLSGKLYTKLSADTVKRLDRYEGHLYHRQRVKVTMTRQGKLGFIIAELYLLRPQYAYLATRLAWRNSDGCLNRVRRRFDLY